MSKITYANKTALNENTGVADANKVNASDMNEIKSVVNANDDTMNAMIVNEQSNSTTNTYSCDYINGTILYANSTGTNDTISLNETAANFNYFEIFYYVNNNDINVYKSVKVSAPNNKNVTLDNVDYINNALVFTTKTVSISGTSITNVRNRRFTIQESSTWTPYGSSATIYITRVIGYK